MSAPILSRSDQDGIERRLVGQGVARWRRPLAIHPDNRSGERVECLPNEIEELWL